MPIPNADSSALAPVGCGDWRVQPGDSISSIASETGHFANTLWNLPENAELRRVRRDPELLVPGDRVTVPPLRRAECSVRIGSHHVFRRRGVPVEIIQVVRNRRGKVYAGCAYTLEVGDKVIDGETDAEGRVREWVDPAAKSAELTVFVPLAGTTYPMVWNLSIGHLEPIESVKGIQARLNSLAYFCGSEDGELGPKTLDALKAFQRAQGLDPTGEPDSDTRARLTNECGR